MNTEPYLTVRVHFADGRPWEYRHNLTPSQVVDLTQEPDVYHVEAGRPEDFLAELVSR